MIKNTLIKNILINTIFAGLSAVNQVISKNSQIILLYSDTTFRDNIKYLYDYLIENHYNEQYFIVCAVKDYQQYNTNEIKNVIFVSPIRGVQVYLKSEHVFYSFGKIPIRPAKNQITVQMWHGTSFKGFSKNQMKTNSYKNMFFTYVYASSEYFRPIVARKFAVPEENIVICGHPRTDTFYKSTPPYNLGAYRKFIFWMPTFRKSTELGMEEGKTNSLIPLVEDDKLSLLDQYLSAHNVLIIVKLHPEQDAGIMNIGQLQNLRLMTHSQFSFDLYELIRQSDALITDYSSVFYDYLLLDRPIGFTEDDIEEYQNSRGFAVAELDMFRPGAKLRTFEDLKKFILDVVQGRDKYKEDRERINNLSNYYQDGKNCERSLQISHIQLDDLSINDY